MLKKIGCVLAAIALLCPMMVTQASDIVNISKLEKEWEEFKPLDYRLIKSGPTLIFSDSPEMVYDNGILYRDKVSGSVRLFFHHVNASQPKKKLAVLVTNRDSLKPIDLTITKQGISEPEYDWVKAGKEAEEAYLCKSAQKYHTTIGFTNSVELLTGRGRVLDNNTLVTGIVDLELSRPAEISILMCDTKADLELFNNSAAVLPIDEHPLRGTYKQADYHYIIKDSLLPKRNEVYYLKMADEQSMLRGMDNTTGQETVDNGNYGVVYTVDFRITGKRKIKMYFNPIGGEFSGYGVLEHKGKRKNIALPKGYSMGKTVEDLVEIGRLTKGEYKFIWSPPGSANLPIRLFWKED